MLQFNAQYAVSIILFIWVPCFILHSVKLKQQTLKHEGMTLSQMVSESGCCIGAGKPWQPAFIK